MGCWVHVWVGPQSENQLSSTCKRSFQKVHGRYIFWEIYAWISKYFASKETCLFLNVHTLKGGRKPGRETESKICHYWFTFHMQESETDSGPQSGLPSPWVAELQLFALSPIAFQGTTVRNLESRAKAELEPRLSDQGCGYHKGYVNRFTKHRSPNWTPISSVYEIPKVLPDKLCRFLHCIMLNKKFMWISCIKRKQCAVCLV